MDQKKWSFPVLKAARWATVYPSPENGTQERLFEDWILWVRAADLPTDLPLDPNARHPNITTPTPREIAKTLRVQPGEFVKRNNGICLVARSCHVKDNIASLLLNVVFEDEEREDGRRGDGILNGGHTYAVLLAVLAEARSKSAVGADTPNPAEAIVRVEVQTGLAEEDLADISRARNKSEPVKEFSLLDLGNTWQTMKAILPKELRHRVAFKENDPEAPDADYDVGDLVRLLALFNARLYPIDKKDPIAAYTSEKRLIASWDSADYGQLLPHLLEFIDLHDEIVLTYPKVMGKPGGVNGVIAHDKSDPLVLLSGRSSRYFIPPPFTFPVLAALRAFLKEDGSRWLVPPEVLIKDERYMKSLVNETWLQYRQSGRSSAAFFGRNRQVWRMLTLTAALKRQSLVN